MHGIPDAGSTDGGPDRHPPDWPAPGTPLAGEEPTVELPVVTEAMLAAAAPTSSPAALSPALNKSTRRRPSQARRFPALERRGPRPARQPAAPPPTTLDDLLTGPTHPAGPTDRAWLAGPTDSAHAPGITGTPSPAHLAGPTRPARPTDLAAATSPTGATGPARPADPAAAAGLPGATAPAGPDDLAGPAESACPARPFDTARTDRGAGRLAGDGQSETRPADSGDGGRPPTGTQPAEPGRGWLIGAGIAAAALLLTGATVVALSRDGDPGTSGWSAPAAAAAPHTVTAALDGRTSAGFDLVDGAERVTLRAADLGGVLYRITTPEAGPVVPRTDERDGRVRLRLDGDAEAVDITLNAAVRWDLRIAGGAESSTIDLSAGRVGGVDLAGGASRIALTLPRPDGTLSVRMSGGVRLFDVHTAERIPVRVRVGRGAGQVTLDGQQHAGVSAGRTFTPESWAAAVDRVDVDAAAGMAALTVAPY
ncbi:hypothetical protein [Actinoplanes auranticolor]|uniref:Uncharacterized protein n=1 Tax=Actinoplanes auranticolor TaxID=47988 RepID=A0A919VRU4_9ACTN|nr:hypothetical protein [Actinoplanes auranticolor]GIM73512.1 hypothetical protein Aau02nite_56410 [Actinoplanes auranticolor]